MGLTPRLGQDTPSLAEAQTGSVYRMSALFPLPHPPLPLESWGLGEGQAGPEGAQEAAKSQACPSAPLPYLAPRGPSARFPVFWFSLQSIGGNEHFKREICRRQCLLTPKERLANGGKIGTVPAGTGFF